MEPLFELAIRLPPRGSGDLLRALHGQLRAAIVDGRLQPGLRMPSTRALAASCAVSRNTVIATYDLLLSEGYLASRRGSGTYVAQGLPRPPEPKAPKPAEAFDRRLNAFWREPALTVRPARRDTPRLNFQLGAPDISLFPFDIWRRLAGRALRRLAKGSFAYAGPQGQPALQEAIARHTSLTRAVACRPEGILITAGAQQAFDLLARTLVTPRRTVVAMEDPGYPPTRSAFAAAGAKIVPIPIDNEGMMVERLPPQVRVICVTPSHQFPLGTAMSMNRRTALLEFARARNAVVIEDDYDCEFRFSERPLDALQTLDRMESVFYVGTFSKSLFPALRLGFIVPPPWALRALLAAKLCADAWCPDLTQQTLAEFIAEGHLARHVRRMRPIYAARRRLLLERLSTDLGRWLEPIPSVAGLHLSAFCKSSLDSDAIVERARQNGVGMYSLRRYGFSKPTRAGLAFGYGVIDERSITEGLTVLKRILRTF